MRRWLGLWLLGFWLVLLWTNPPDADLWFLRFYAHRAGNPDTLRSDPYLLYGVDPDGTPWQRSVPGAGDECEFALPPGTWDIWVTAIDTTGVNESGPSNVVTRTIASLSLAAPAPTRHSGIRTRVSHKTRK